MYKVYCSTEQLNFLFKNIQFRLQDYIMATIKLLVNFLSAEFANVSYFLLMKGSASVLASYWTLRAAAKSFTEQGFQSWQMSQTVRKLALFSNTVGKISFA